jgi:hypothetical protein
MVVAVRNRLLWRWIRRVLREFLGCLTNWHAGLAGGGAM